MAWIDSRAADCGSRCEVSSLGTSHEGNDMKLIKVIQNNFSIKSASFMVWKSRLMKLLVTLKITNGDGSEKEGYWIDAGIHAREWIAPAVATYFIDRVIIQTHLTSLQ